MIIEKDYDKEDNSGYGTHIPCLKAIFDNIEIDFAIEYGMGYFSTSFLLDRVKSRVHSIEMQDLEWYDKVVAKYDSDKWTHEFSEDVTRFVLNQNPDLLLVDGSSVTRAIGIVHAMQMGIGIIVAHDTESPWYGYDMVEDYRERYGYTSIHFTDVAPFTSVYTTNEKLIGDLNLIIADKNEL
jgi:hypothetical protein